MDRDDSLKKLAKNKPVLCSQVQPWKDPKVTHEMILEDLTGCIIRHYLAYKFGTVGYTPQDAISEAYESIRKAIDKDKHAPTLAGKTVKCPKCKQNIQMPLKFAGDERAEKICMESPRPMRYRRFLINCSHCNHDFWKKVYKVPFSTLVYPFIRSAIQRSAQKWRRTNVVPIKNYANNNTTIENKGHVISIDGPPTTDSEFSIKDTLTTPEPISREKIPENVIILLRQIISEMPQNHKIAIAFHKGIGGLVTGIVSNKIKCCHCKNKNKPTEFEAEIDYSLDVNIVTCPVCGWENKINMCLSQTTIASYLDITKQRVHNIIRTVEGKLYKALRSKISPNSI